MASPCSPQNPGVNHVPYDIWRAVFGIYISDSAKSSIKFDPKAGPLLLGQICSAWRRIAVESPELWCNIEVTVDEDCHGFPDKKLLELALERARRSPLRLALCGERTAPPASKTRPETVDMVDILLTNVSRAVHLEVDVRIIQSTLLDRPRGPQRFHKFIGPGIPCLKRLKISGQPSSFPPYFYEHEQGPPINPIMAKLWTPAPKLRTLDLCGNIHFQNSSIMESFAPSLDHLSLLNMASPISSEDFLSILSATKQLTQCTVQQLIGELPVYGISQHPIQLQFLSHLDIRGSGEDSRDDEPSPPLTEVVKYIQAPSLTSLHLRHDRGWSQSSFSAFLQNSSCTILHLTLDIEDSDEIEKLECLELLPSLKSLNMSSGNRYTRESDSPDFLTAIFADALKERDFSRRDAPFRICPILDHFEFDYDALDDHASMRTVFAKMIEERLLQSTHFRSVCIREVKDGQSRYENYGYVSFEILRLLALRRYGLKVELDPAPCWAVLLE
ncbi:hypothetical protein GALMADRAFT_281882 [Galerina marginata CBS 339.88]|uniref:F-box domain-containing protein n=1 Tax=Galerina marginata (strain CBS 339.88) TaxID=685588 RepID=A0A067SK14_GALM3|nr:hypothetical protein GALMADRAFT_281882 [Galerina marginata CBS 339.88]